MVPEFYAMESGFLPQVEKKNEEFSCPGIISIETKQNTPATSSTERFFFNPSLRAVIFPSLWDLPGCSWARGLLFLFPCPAPLGPDGAGQRWLTLAPHLGLLWQWQRSERSAPGKWTKETCIRAESPCPIIAGSSDPLIFLSFCDMFRKSFACAVYSLWVFYLLFWANRESAFRFW